MESEIHDFFAQIIRNIIPVFKLYAYTDILEIPSEKHSNADNIKSYLAKENTLTPLYIFVDDSAYAVEGLFDELEQELNFCNADLYLYVCDDLDSVDIQNYDLLSYQYSRSVFKKDSEPYN